MTAITKIEANGQDPITMTSLELVDFINEQRAPGESELRHDHFMVKVPKVLGESHAPKFLGTQVYGNNNTRAIYSLPKREACLMAMSYSYELQAKVFDRMTALEASQAQAVPLTYAQTLRLAAEQAEMLEQQQAALALAAPKVEFVDRYAAANGAKGFRQVAKLLQANEHEFRAWLQDSKVMYRLGGEWSAYQNHIDAGRFVVKTGVATANEHAFNTTLFTPKGVEWVAGEWGKYQAAKRAEVVA